MSSFSDKIREPELTLKKEAGMSFNGGVTTEFSMWLLDSVAISHMADSIQEHSFHFNLGESSRVFDFFYAMVEMWDKLKVIVKDEEDSKKIDAELAVLLIRIRNLEALKNSNMPMSIPNDIRDSLREIKRKLFQLKQDVGLGIPSVKNFTVRERLRNALR